MKRSLAALLALLLLPTLAACGDDGAEAGDKPVVTVEDQGSGERATFLLDVEEGHSETSVMTIDQRIDAGQVVDAPPIELTLTTKVTGVSDDEIEVLTTYDAARVTEPDDPAASAIEDALADITQLTSTSTFSRSGELLDSDLDIPDGLTGAARQTVEQLGDQSQSLTVAFPTEELGVGARWTATSALELNGVTVQQKTTYELTALDGDDYEISVDVTQEFEEGEAEGFDVESGEGSTSGTISGTIGNLSPSEARSTGTNRISVSTGGQSQTVTTDTDLTVTTTVD